MTNIFCNLFPPRVFHVLMESEEDCVLTPEMEAEATERDDDLGRLVTVAFAFDMSPFPFGAGGSTFQPTGGA